LGAGAKRGSGSTHGDHGADDDEQGKSAVYTGASSRGSWTENWRQVQQVGAKLLPFVKHFEDEALSFLLKPCWFVAFHNNRMAL
jgi:hypothetical protein